MKKIFRFFLACFAGLFFFFLTGAWYIIKDLPDPRFLNHYAPSSLNWLYDAQGHLLQEWGKDYRIFTSYPNIPSLLVQAFLCAEDKYFFQHPGIDFISIVRSVVRNVGKKNLFGGSTITQQIAKNFLIGDERTFLRKVREAILALQIERYLSKQKILEIYLNHIYLGKGSYGVAAAARKYFKKSLQDLNASDMAFLAALPKYPGMQDMDRIKVRRNWVLKKMQQESLISVECLNNAIKEKLPIVQEKVKTMYGHYFLEIAKKEAQKTIKNLSGAHIITTMNPWLQCLAEQNLQKHLNSYNATSKIPLTGGLILMEAQTGKVLAHTGGYHFYVQKFDCASQAKRQVGSLFKPFVYLTAFEKGLTPRLSFYDQPLVFDHGAYRPKNISGRHYGRVSIEQAFIHSHNLITVQLAQYVGMPSILKMVKRFDIFPHFKREWASVLGACEASLLEMTTAYASIANGGYKMTPTFIQSIDGKTVQKPKPKILSDQASALMCNLMERVVSEGTAKKLALLQNETGWVIGAKTGTTNQNKDVWFVGFIKVPSGKIYAVGVFLGFLLPKSLGESMTAGVLATPLAYAFLSEAKRYLK